jgi:hypothetical protein
MQVKNGSRLRIPIPTWLFLVRIGILTQIPPLELSHTLPRFNFLRLHRRVRITVRFRAWEFS